MKKKYILLFIVGILLIGILVATILISASDNVIIYSKDNKIAEVKYAKALEESIAKVELKTPFVNNVIRGKDRKVMIFDIENFKDYSDAIGNVEITNIKTSNIEDKNYYYEYGIYGDVEVLDYKEICEEEYDPINKTHYKICRQEKIGSHIENKIVDWKVLNSKDISKGNLTIALITDVKAGDHYDGIPTLFGEKLTKWAEWTESLNNSLIGYWDFNQSSGSILPDVYAGENNGTLIDMNDSNWVSGKINNALLFDGSNEWVHVIPDVSSTINNSYTTAFWVNASSNITGATTKAITNRKDGPNDHAFYWDSTNANYQQACYQTAGTCIAKLTTSLVKDTWYFIMCNWNGTDLNAYLNGNLETSVTCVGHVQGAGNMSIGSGLHVSGAMELPFDGLVDEYGLWNRTLSASEISDLWNGGDGITYGRKAVINVNITYPLNETYNYFVSELNYTSDGDNCWYSFDSGVTNSSTQTAGTNWTGLSSSGGSNTWNVYCNDSENLIGSDNVTFTVNVSVLTELISPLDLTNYSINNVNFTFNSTPNNANLTFVTMYVWNSSNDEIYTNRTTLSGTSEVTTGHNVTNLPDGNHTWNALTNGTSNLSDWDVNRTFIIDTTAPVIDITSISNTTYWTRYAESNSINITINSTQSDAIAGLSACWWSNDSGLHNHTFTCGSNVSSLETFGEYTITVWANDTFGNLGSDSVTATWTYLVLENLLDYNNETLEGNSENFYLDFNVTSSLQVSTLSLNYNNTVYFGSFVKDGNNYNGTVTVEIPNLLASTNQSLYFNVTLSNLSTAVSSRYNQSVLVLTVDDCSANSVLILNYTLKDEENQNLLNGSLFNTTIDVDLNVFPIGSNTTILNFSGNYNITNPAQVCVNINLSDSSYRIDIITRYVSQNREVEYNNLQNFTLQNSSIPQNIDLLDLLTADSTEFLITFKDNNFIVVEDALVTITRYYIDDGVFKTVEIPKTDSNGQTIGHFVEKDVIYTIIVSKYGVNLGTFSNQIAICEDATIGDCEINLNAFISGTESTDFDTYLNLNYLTTFNQSSRTITTTFNTIDGSTSTILINSTLFDAYGNTTVCSDSLLSSAGTLVCSIPETFGGNITILVELFNNGDLVSTQTYSMADDPMEIFGYMGILLLLILVITLPLMMITSTVGMIIAGIFGFIIAGMLNVYTGGSMFGFGSTIIWLIIAGGIIIYKITQEGES